MLHVRDLSAERGGSAVSFRPRRFPPASGFVKEASGLDFGIAAAIHALALGECKDSLFHLVEYDAGPEAKRTGELEQHLEPGLLAAVLERGNGSAIRRFQAEPRCLVQQLFLGEIDRLSESPQGCSVHSEKSGVGRS